MRTGVRFSIICFASLAFAEGLPAPVQATIQPEMCIAPDIEYPVPCDEDDD